MFGSTFGAQMGPRMDPTITKKTVLGSSNFGTVWDTVWDNLGIDVGAVWNTDLNPPPLHSCYNCAPASLGRWVSALALTIWAPILFKPASCLCLFYWPRHFADSIHRPRTNITDMFGKSPEVSRIPIYPFIHGLGEVPLPILRSKTTAGDEAPGS